MKQSVLAPLFLGFCLLGYLSSQEIIVLDNSDAVNFSEKMNRNNAFFRFCRGVDVDKYGRYYFLDRMFSHIIKVDQNTGGLIKTISSKGQGPQELDQPEAFRIKNEKIFVIDRSYGGVKIFDLEGNFIKAIKTNSNSLDIDVTSRDEIYVDKFDEPSNTLISVFSFDGSEIKSLVELSPELSKDRIAFIRETRIKFAVDKNENLFVLYALKREIKKFNASGRLMWVREIKNDILDKLPQEDEVEIGQGTATVTNVIFDLDINNRGEVLIGHANGGMLFDTNGKALKTIHQDFSLMIFKLFGDKLISVFPNGEYTYIFNF